MMMAEELEWFPINLDTIRENSDRIRNVCLQSGHEALLKSFVKANEIANVSYPCRFEICIFKKDLPAMSEKALRKMCQEVGGGMANEVMYYLAVQMQICNGQSVKSLFNDKVLVIQMRNGKDTGFFGSSAIPKVRNYFHYRLVYSHEGTPCAYRFPSKS